MKKFFFLLLFIPILGISQNKNVSNYFRVFPKVDKVLEFEKALTAHAQKYHTGDWKWRVFEIQTGPDANGFHISEGPTSWDAFDKRGNLGTEHNNDWNKKVTIYLTDKGSSGFLTFNDTLSTVALTDYSDKVVVNHMFQKPGMVGGAMGIVRNLRKVWLAGNESVAVYTASNSGEPEIITATRLKNGLKELAGDYRGPLRERFNKEHGPGSFDTYLQDLGKYIETRWSEIIFYRADLSSK